MKFLAFEAPSEFWHGLDWIKDFATDSKNDHVFLLIDAKKAEIAREIAAEHFYNANMRAGGIEFIIEQAFYSFTGMEYEDNDDIFEFFGPKDGQTVMEFYNKYTWEAFADEKISFHGNFEKEDRMKFYDFDIENLKKLYINSEKWEILVFPVTHEIKQQKAPRK